MLNRTFAKSSAARLIGSILRGPDSALAVLTYHSVGTGSFGSIAPALFAGHLKAIQQLGGFEWLDWRHKANGRKEGLSCLVTLDDGYMDNFTHAAQVLEDQGAKALFFITTAFLERSRDITTEFRNYRGLPPMSWDQVGSLVERGHSVGLHGHTHQDFARMSDAEASDEFSASTEILRRRLGLEPDSFAYPFGQFQNRRSDLGRLIAGTNVRYIFTTDHRRARLQDILPTETPVLIPRLRVDATDDEYVVRQKMRGTWDYIAALQRVKACIALSSLGPLTQSDR